MVEPTYIFKKGEGWILGNEPAHKFACGTLCRLEFRKPEPGECYDHGAALEFGSTEQPNAEAWLSFLGKLQFKFGTLRWRGNRTHVDGGCYVVFVPV